MGSQGRTVGASAIGANASERLNVYLRIGANASERLKVATAAALHFLVDGLCVCCLYLLVKAADVQDFLPVFITYNVLAFLTQPLTGHIADIMRHRHWLLLAVIILLTVATAATTAVIMNSSLFTFHFSLFISIAVLLGTGNSLFHVWGGKEVAVTTQNDIRALGVFVAPGAFGLVVGIAICSWWTLYAFLAAICLLSLIPVGMCRGTRRGALGGTQCGVFSSEQPISPIKPIALLAVLAIMAFVAGRSYAGEALATALPSLPWMALVIGFIAMFGKIAGGWMAPPYLVTLTALVALTAICIAFKETGWPVALAGLFTVNCTMAITLYLANRLMPGREGLAFGLLAASLMPGYILASLS